PLPTPRRVERVLQRHGLTAPRARRPPLRPRQEYPGPQARASNELHEVDLVGPVYLKGNRHRYSLWVGKDAFDGAVCLRLAGSRLYLRLVIDTGRGQLTAYLNGRVLKRWPYRLLNE